MSLSYHTITDTLRKYWRPFERRDVMLKLDEYNSQMMSEYGLEGKQWRKGDVACPRCKEEVAMLEQVGVTHTSHPPKIKVRCPECDLISYKIV